ncbi:MAG: hypothetical protein IJ760_01150 [Bacteroidales bacterium]|nr:hypothetical protein [Bacteroidales bacterium]
MSIFSFEIGCKGTHFFHSGKKKLHHFSKPNNTTLIFSIIQNNFLSTPPAQADAKLPTFRHGKPQIPPKVAPFVPNRRTPQADNHSKPATCTHRLHPGDVSRPSVLRLFFDCSPIQNRRTIEEQSENNRRTDGVDMEPTCLWFDFQHNTKHTPHNTLFTNPLTTDNRCRAGAQGHGLDEKKFGRVAGCLYLCKIFRQRRRGVRGKAGRLRDETAKSLKKSETCAE